MIFIKVNLFIKKHNWVWELEFQLEIVSGPTDTLKDFFMKPFFSQNQHWAFPEELELVNKVFKSLLRQKSEWKWETKEQRKNGTQQRHRNNNKNGDYERNWYKEKAKIFEKESFPWHTRCDVDAVLDVSSENLIFNSEFPIKHG